jgi:hypothetical protein
MRKAVRQGDVLIWPVTAIPETAVELAPHGGRLIVAHGEATGHHHSFPHLRGAVLFRDDGSGGTLYVRADRPTPIEHQEHSALTVSNGASVVIRQRTFVAGLARRVVD